MLLKNEFILTVITFSIATKHFLVQTEENGSSDGKSNIVYKLTRTCMNNEILLLDGESRRDVGGDYKMKPRRPISRSLGS